MSTPRRSLYERLPEIYRIRDGEQRPAGQLEAFMGVLDEVMAGMRDSIEALHHDHFIDTCDDWVVPYVADLLGVSHLSGDPWTLRADVARTVFHRRRKGTLGAVESLSFSLTGWAAHAVEMRERLAWNQHLNHQRPDEGGTPPLALRTDIGAAVRGGTATLRSPAMLSFAGGPFDPLARVVDVKPGLRGASRPNLPNLGVFLWRLADYRVPLATPGMTDAADIPGAAAGEAASRVRVELHAQSEPVRLFNRWRYRADDDPPELSVPDAVPGPMPPARLTTDSPHGNPSAYVAVDEWSGEPQAPGEDSPGLVLHLPEADFGGLPWTFRGANLCAWEAGLRPALRPFEIVVDPDLGRVVVGVNDTATEGSPLADALLVSWTYGFSGPTGAHPVPRDATPDRWLEKEEEEGVGTSVLLRISRDDGPAALETALSDLPARPGPTIIEIADSGTYTLDIGNVGIAGGMVDDGDGLSFRLAHSLWIRAASGERPTVRVTEPLRFRPLDVNGAGDVASAASLTVRLEGLYLTWERAAAAFASDGTALVERVALGSMELDGCTLDPGGARLLDGSPDGARTSPRPAFRLADGYGFAPGSADETDFDEVPVIDVNRCIVGGVLADQGYRLFVADSIVDANAGVGDPDPGLAVGTATGDPDDDHGPETEFEGVTFLGRVRVLRIAGSGGLFLHELVAHDDQTGCVRLSRFEGVSDRPPPNHGCVRGATVSFADERLGEPGYAQLRLRSDRRVLEEGPQRDAMGAFGYLLNAHKWKNLDIRYREYMPVGVRPVLVPVT